MNRQRSAIDNGVNVGEAGIRAVVAPSPKLPAVFDIITNPTEVHVEDN